MKGKTVLITGGKGFIGRALSAQLIRMGCAVNFLDVRVHEPYLGVSDWDTVQNLFQQFRPEVVFHLAAQTEVAKSFSEPHLTYAVNVAGTLNVLEACRLNAVQSVVIASSDKAYGNPASLPIKESDPLLDNADVYSSSKRHADELAQMYARTYGMPVKIVRCCNVYGPGQTNESTLITGTIERVLRGEKPIVHDANIREWMYVEDAVEAYLRIAQVDGSCAVNVGSGYRATAVYVVRALLGALEKPKDWYVMSSHRCRQAGDQYVDSSKYRIVCGEHNFMPLTMGLRKTVTWHREKRCASTTT